MDNNDKEEKIEYKKDYSDYLDDMCYAFQWAFYWALIIIIPGLILKNTFLMPALRFIVMLGFTFCLVRFVKSIVLAVIYKIKYEIDWKRRRNQS